MALNLSRNTKLYVSTLDETGAHSSANTFEVPIMDGYSFSQDAATTNITLNEAGCSPVRGQKVFNTALNPASFSITTYVRPYFVGGNHNAVEALLWEALVGAGPAGTNARPGASYMQVDFEGSNVHELLKLFLYFKLGNVTYLVRNAYINTAEIDFSIDGIAQITWSGQGTDIVETSEPDSWAAGVDYAPEVTSAQFIKNKLSTMYLAKATGTTSGSWTVDYNNSLLATAAHTLDGTSTYTATVTVDGGAVQNISINSLTFTGTTVQDVVDEINAQLEDAVVSVESGNIKVESATSGSTSTVLVVDGATGLFAEIDTANFTSIGAATAGTGTLKNYNIAITGGSISIDNGITFLTPEELGKVNIPIGAFTGTRAISGNVSAYLNTGASSSGGLLSDLVSATDTVTHEFQLTLSMGGCNSAPRVDFIMNHAHLVIPSINVQDVISTDINFTALAQDIDKTDELVVKYYAQ